MKKTNKISGTSETTDSLQHICIYMKCLSWEIIIHFILWLIEVVQCQWQQYFLEPGRNPEFHLLIAFTFALHLIQQTEAKHTSQEATEDLLLPTIPTETLHKVRTEVASKPSLSLKVSHDISNNNATIPAAGLLSISLSKLTKLLLPCVQSGQTCIQYKSKTPKSNTKYSTSQQSTISGKNIHLFYQFQSCASIFVWKR